MTDRKSISIDEDLHADLKARKRSGESWSDFLRRLQTWADEGQTGEPQDHPVDALDALTEDHIDDIAVRTARETVDELETRQR